MKLFKRIIDIKYPKGFIPPPDGETLIVTADKFWPDDDKPEKPEWDPLTELAKRYDSDKWNCHWYTPHYHRHFQHLRRKPITLLEIGVGGYISPTVGGFSLRMWKEYFPKATIVGLDYYYKKPLDEDRIITEQGDQADPKVFEALAEKYGEFDIIIDDGSHNSAKTVSSFHLGWPLLKKDGIYVIEDLQTSYWPQFGGSSDPDADFTSVAFLKSLVDNINYEERDVTNYFPTELDKTIVGLSFYKNIAFIQKGENNEGSIGLPPHPHAQFLTKEYLASKGIDNVHMEED